MVCAGPARRGAEGGHDGGWRLRVAAVANCEATDRFVNSASPQAAAPRSLTDVLWPETLQPPHAPDGGGTATGRRRIRPGEGLPTPVPTQTRGSLRAVIECAGTYITRRQPPQVLLQLWDTRPTEEERVREGTSVGLRAGNPPTGQVPAATIGGLRAGDRVCGHLHHTEATRRDEHWAARREVPTNRPGTSGSPRRPSRRGLVREHLRLLSLGINNEG